MNPEGTDLTNEPLVLPRPNDLEGAVAVARRLYSGSQRLFEARIAEEARFPHMFFALTSETGARAFPLMWNNETEEQAAGHFMRSLATRAQGHGLWGVLLVMHAELRVVDLEAAAQLGVRLGTFELDAEAMKFLEANSDRQTVLAARLETYLGDWCESTEYSRADNGAVIWHPPQPMPIAMAENLTNLLPPLPATGVA